MHPNLNTARKVQAQVHPRRSQQNHRLIPSLVLQMTALKHYDWVTVDHEYLLCDLCSSA